MGIAGRSLIRKAKLELSSNLSGSFKLPFQESRGGKGVREGEGEGKVRKLMGLIHTHEKLQIIYIGKECMKNP